MIDEAAAQVRLLCLDVDGVMTDGRILIDDRGIETKSFHVRDGTAIRMWLSLGNEVAIITGRSGMAVAHRAAELGVRLVYQGVAHKLEALARAAEQTRVDVAEIAVLGDDLPDLPMLRACGYPMAVADAVPEVREVAEFHTVRPGGHAAVREAIEHLIKSRGEWDAAVSRFDPIDE